MELQNKTFVVTGGGSGLGAATARVFAEAGAHVVMFDVQEEAGQRVAEEIGGRYVRVDVTSDEDVKHGVAEAAAAYGGLHGAVNCAGIGVAAKVLGKEGPAFAGRLFPRDPSEPDWHLQRDSVGGSCRRRGATQCGRRTWSHCQHRLCGRFRGTNRAGCLLSFKRWRRRYDTAHRQGTGAVRDPRGRHCTGHF